MTSSVGNKASAVRVVVLTLTVRSPLAMISNGTLLLLTNQEPHLALEVFRATPAFASRTVSAFTSVPAKQNSDAAACTTQVGPAWGSATRRKAGLFFLYLAYVTEVDGSNGNGLKEHCLFTTETLRQTSAHSAVSSKCLLPPWRPVRGRLTWLDSGGVNIKRSIHAGAERATVQRGGGERKRAGKKTAERQKT